MAVTLVIVSVNNTLTFDGAAKAPILERRVRLGLTNLSVLVS